MGIDPWGPIVLELFEDGSSDYILNSLQRAGLPATFDLTQDEAFSHNTRKRAYQRRLGPIYARLEPAERLRVARNLSHEIAKTEGGLARLKTALKRVGWEFQAGELVQSSPVENEAATTTATTAAGQRKQDQHHTRALLAEIEEVIDTMPPRATIRHEAPENHQWFGRASAAIEKWHPPKSALVKEYLDLFHNNSQAREAGKGLNKLSILLDQAKADLRLELRAMASPSNELSVQDNAWKLLSAIYEKTKDTSRPVDDVATLATGLSAEEAGTAFRYLKSHGLIETFNLPNAARINAHGIDAVEKRSPKPEASSGSHSQSVFVGHGRSLVWLQLKGFLTDRLHLKCDEFNAEAVAGLTTTERLQALLDSAGFAFLVMTAEDAHADNSTHARENVIHEAGLFQGRLGFKRAIILLEEGCVQFSNIHGLSYIGFLKGNLEPTFEKVRHVLEREHIL